MQRTCKQFTDKKFQRKINEETSSEYLVESTEIYISERGERHSSADHLNFPATGHYHRINVTAKQFTVAFLV